MTDLPIVIGPEGPVPQTPASLRSALLALVGASNPGYTANLPASLIEDIASTDVGALVTIDSARVDLINSLTPYSANVFLLQELGAIYGVLPGQDTNTSVYVIFTGPAGLVLAKGFTVSDGSHQYVLADGGIIGTGGVSLPLFAVGTVTGSWAVPPGTVNQLITSVPTGISLAVTNQVNGVPSGGEQTEESYRTQVLQAGLAASMGMARYLKTLLSNVPGVQQRLVSVRQAHGSYEIICGGGDPYQVAYAIFDAMFDINNLIGSVLSVTNISQANPGVVTTDLTHGFTTGQVINIAGVVGMTPVNNTPLTVTVLTPHTFSIGVNTTGYPAYVSGGVITPNLRNISVTINDVPDTYVIPFVNPPQQQVNIVLNWGTTSANLVSDTAVAQLGGPALVAYVNGIYAGQPMNLFELQAVFQQAVASLIPAQLLTRMAFAVSIDNVGVAPVTGTGIIAGDPEGYFLTDTTKIVINQG